MKTIVPDRWAKTQIATGFGGITFEFIGKIIKSLELIVINNKATRFLDQQNQIHC